MRPIFLIALYALFDTVKAFAAAGGSHVGEASRKANSIIPFIFLAVLVIIAVIDRFRK